MSSKDKGKGKPKAVARRPLFGRAAAKPQKEEEEKFVFDRHATHRARIDDGKSASERYAEKLQKQKNAEVQGQDGKSDGSQSPQPEDAQDSRHPLSHGDLAALAAVGSRKRSGSGFAASDGSASSDASSTASSSSSSAASNEARGEASLRLAMIEFFVCCAPHRLPEIPKLLKAYWGRQMDLKLQFRREFNHVPSEGETENVINVDDRARLMAYFAHYNPAKVRDVDYLLQKYWGIEDELWAALEEKYGREQNVYQLYVVEEARIARDFEAVARETRRQGKPKGDTRNLAPPPAMPEPQVARGEAPPGSMPEDAPRREQKSEAPTRAAEPDATGAGPDSTPSGSGPRRRKSVRFGVTSPDNPSPLQVPKEFELPPALANMSIEESTVYDPEAPVAAVKPTRRPSEVPAPTILRSPAMGPRLTDTLELAGSLADIPRMESFELTPGSRTKGPQMLPPTPGSPQDTSRGPRHQDPLLGKDPLGNQAGAYVEPQADDVVKDLGAVTEVLKKLGVNTRTLHQSTMFVSSASGKAPVGTTHSSSTPPTQPPGSVGRNRPSTLAPKGIDAADYDAL